MCCKRSKKYGNIEMNCPEYRQTPFFLKGKKILLRPLADEDAFGNYPQWLNDSTVCAGNSHAVYPYTKEQALEFIHQSRGRKDLLVLAIVDQSSGRHIGNISLQSINFVNRSAEVAILLGDKELWGKGFGTEAVALLIRHAFLRSTCIAYTLAPRLPTEECKKLARPWACARKAAEEKHFIKTEHTKIFGNMDCFILNLQTMQKLCPHCRVHPSNKRRAMRQDKKCLQANRIPVIHFDENQMYLACRYSKEKHSRKRGLPISSLETTSITAEADWKFVARRWRPRV